MWIVEQKLEMDEKSNLEIDRSKIETKRYKLKWRELNELIRSKLMWC